MLASSAARGESRTVETPRFQIEIQAAGEGSPKYTVTNLSGKTITACVMELSSSSQSVRKSETVWDALLQEVPPIEPGASISQYLSHVVGGPLPDRVEVVAGVWADGETFGEARWVNIILKSREMRAIEYDQTAAMLQQGLDQNWTCDRYLQALGSKPNSGPIRAVRATLIANRQSGEKPEFLRRLVQTMRDSLAEKSGQLRKAEPASVATPH